MSLKPKYVNEGQVLMCNFELCSINNQNCKGTANILPEFGKTRPVVVIKAHKITKTAIIVPLTTENQGNNILYVITIPKGVLKGKLKDKDCYALCDRVQTISIARLSATYDSESNKYISFEESILERKYYVDIVNKVKNVFMIK